MKNNHCTLIVLMALLLCGFADIAIKDIETAIIQQDYERAKQAATQLLSDPSMGSEYEDIRYYIALCDLRLGNYQDAKTIFSDLTQRSVDDKLRDKAYLGLFDTYYMSGHYQEAYEIIERLLSVSPKSEFLSLVYLKMARANLKLAQWYKARQFLEKITSDFPDSMEVHIAKQLLNEKQYFAVQVGAFMNETKAKQLVGQLQKKGEYAYIVETIDRENRTFYRVRVGQLVLLDKAQKLKLKLSKEGYPTQIYP